MVVRVIFSSILQIWYVDVRISRSISESPLEFEITRVDCIVYQHRQNLRKHVSVPEFIYFLFLLSYLWYYLYEIHFGYHSSKDCRFGNCFRCSQCSFSLHCLKLNHTPDLLDSTCHMAQTYCRIGRCQALKTVHLRNQITPIIYKKLIYIFVHICPSCISVNH